MPDINQQLSYLQQLQDVRNPNSTMGALNQLVGSIGNTFQGYEAGRDERDLTSFFMENNVTPDKIKEFSDLHPQMPQIDIFKKAGRIQNQMEAQEAKDYFSTVKGLLSQGVDPEDPKILDLQKSLKRISPQKLNELTKGIFETTTMAQQVKENKLKLTEMERVRDNEMRAAGALRGLSAPKDVPEVAMYPVTDPDATMGGETDYPGYTGKTKTVTPKVALGDVYRAILPYTSIKEMPKLLKEWQDVGKDEQKDVMQILISPEYDDASKKIIVDSIKSGKEIPFESLKRQQKEQKLMKGPGGVMIPEVAGAVAFGDDKPSAYGDFAKGFKADYRAKHPGATEEEVSLATSNEAQRRGIEKGITISVAGSEARGRAFADERYYSMYDTQTGQTVKVKGYALNGDSGGRYLDVQDPNLKADSGSLVKVTKGMDSVNAFEKGASQALDYSLTVAKDFGLGKYPQANKISQLFQYHLGDPKVKGLKNSITTAATEYMKVINAGSDLTAAELSVMGQQRAKEIMEGADNLESLQNSVKIMKREMQISGDKFKAQRTEVRGRMKGYGGGQPGTAPAAETKTVVERRASKTRPGVTLVRYEDGTLGEE